MIDANTDPRDVTFVSKLVLKSDVRKMLWENHRWDSYHIVQKPGLQNALLFLTIDAGIEEELEPFRQYVQDKADELLVRFADLGAEYAQAAEEAATAVREAAEAKHLWSKLSCAIEDLRRAVGFGAHAALRAAFGKAPRDSGSYFGEIDHEIAEKLIDTLRKARLI